MSTKEPLKDKDKDKDSTTTKQREAHTFKCLRCSYKTTVKANFLRHTKRKYPCTYNLDSETNNPSEPVESSKFNEWLVQFVSDGNEKNNTNIGDFVNNKYKYELSEPNDPMISGLIEEIKTIVHNFEKKTHYLKAICLIANKFTQLDDVTDEVRYSMVYTLKNTIEINHIANAFYENLNM
jgi:hypothetical protein